MRTLAALLSAAVVFFALPWQQAGAGEPAVTLGEVSAQASQRRDVDEGALRDMAADAVRTLDDTHLPRGAHAVLSVSLVRLESRTSASADVACVVSATLRDKKRGAVFAVLEGSARGQDEPRHMATLERATVRAALRSAVSRVPEAMMQRRRR